MYTDLDAYNRLHSPPLIEALDNQNVSVLVGAGTSIACGYPGWTAFLEALEQSLSGVLAETYLERLRAFDIRVRLDAYARHLGPAYDEIFKTTFSPRDTAPTAPEWIRRILDLPARYLLTTNYTSELERVAVAHPALPLGINPQPVRWHNPDDLTRAIRRSDAVLRLVYLHGRYDDSPELIHQADGSVFSKIILGEQSYKFAYEHPGRLKQQLAAICQTSTLLIIGASLRDEDVTGTLRFAMAVSGSARTSHYVILPLRNDDDPEKVAADYRSRFALQPVFYPVASRADGTDDHAAIETLLRHLDNESGRQRRWRPLKSTSPEAHTRSSAKPSVAVESQSQRWTPLLAHALLQARDFESRPEFRRVIDGFLNAERGGVLALSGIGGSGKTALIRSVIDDVLSGAVVGGPTSLDAIFVWSFYFDPDVTSFFRELAGYLGRAAVSADCSEVTAYNLVRAACRPNLRILIVLDGLERIQFEWPSEEHAHGAIPSSALRQLLLWMTQAPVATRTLITTRFRLPELESEGGQARFRLLVVDALSRRQARNLLERRGVRGSEHELDTILDYYGTHALTLDHLAGVLVTYLNCEAGRFRELGSGPLTRFDAGTTGARLARVLSAYDAYLANTEPAIRDVLARVALFRRPVGARLIWQFFLRNSSPFAGGLAGGTELDLNRWLSRLCALRLLSEERAAQEPLYLIHPAVRDAVLAGLGREWAVLAGAVRQELELRLAPQSGRSDFAQDLETLDRLEDILGFGLDEREVSRAVDLYWDRIGGFTALATAGQYSRGERICRRLLESLGGLDALARRVVRSGRQGMDIYHDLAKYLTSLGRLTEAVELLRRLSAASNEHEFAADLAYAELTAGFPASARALASDLSTRTGDGTMMMRTICLARSALCLGDPAEAIAFFEDCMSGLRSSHLIGLHHRAKVDLLLTLLQCEKAELARDAAERLALEGDEGVAWKSLIVGEAHRQGHRYENAAHELSFTREWALRTGAQELLVYSLLYESALAEAVPHLQRKRNATLEATENAREALRIADTCGYGLLCIDATNTLARLAIADGNPQRGLEYAAEALRQAEDSRCQYFWGTMTARRTLAQIWAALGKYGAAREHDKAAIAMATQLEDRMQFFDDMVRGLYARDGGQDYGDLRGYPLTDDDTPARKRRRSGPRRSS